MNLGRIYTLLPLAGSEEELEESLRHIGRRGPRGGMVVLVEGRECVKIPMSQGKFAIVDVDDYADVGRFRWAAHYDHPNWYASRTFWDTNRYVSFPMHRYLLGFPDNDIDHINRNGLDNRRCNLRQATSSENGQGKHFSGRRWIGPSWKAGRWRSGICKDGIKIHIGRFDTEIEAAQAYDAIAVVLYGPKAKLNFPLNP